MQGFHPQDATSDWQRKVNQVCSTQRTFAKADKMTDGIFMGGGGEFNLKPQQPMMSAGIGSAAASQSVHGTRSTAPEAEQLQVKIFLSQSLINHFIAAKKVPNFTSITLNKPVLQ